MSMWSRAKSISGGDRDGTTLAAATTVYVPDHSNLFYLTGTAAITSLLASAATRNRIVLFYQSDSGATTFTNTADTTTEGQMDLGTGDIILGQTDTLELLLRPDGSWVRVSNVSN